MISTACLVLIIVFHSLVESKALLSFFTASFYDVYQYKTTQLTIDLQEWLSFDYGVSVFFVDMEMVSIDPAFDISASNLWKLGKVPIISWMPQRNNATWNANATGFLGSGADDDYLRAWFTKLQNFIAGEDGVLNTSDDRRVMIRLGHEMNGGWYPYSQNQNRPSTYISMWQHIVQMTRNEFSLQKDQVAYMWCVDTTDGIEGAPAESWYPGGEYVDWVAIDGYNPAESALNGSWISPDSIFPDMVTRMEAYGKPLAIPEFGSIPKLPAGDPQAGFCSGTVGQLYKNQWILDALSLFKSHKSIKLISHFNINKQDPGTILGQPWAVFSTAKDNTANCAQLCYCSEGIESFQATSNITYNVYPEFKQRISMDGDYWIFRDPTNPRIIDTDSFLGINSSAIE